MTAGKKEPRTVSASILWRGGCRTSFSLKSCNRFIRLEEFSGSSISSPISFPTLTYPACFLQNFLIPQKINCSSSSGELSISIQTGFRELVPCYDLMNFCFYFMHSLAKRGKMNRLVILCLRIQIKCITASNTMWWKISKTRTVLQTNSSCWNVTPQMKFGCFQWVQSRSSSHEKLPFHVYRSK